MKNIKVWIGYEYDDFLFKTLIDVLKMMKGVIENKYYGVAGSQDIDVFSVNLNGEKILIERETYLGLIISGNKLVIEDIINNIYNKSIKDLINEGYIKEIK